MTAIVAATRPGLVRAARSPAFDWSAAPVLTGDWALQAGGTRGAPL